ncbi:NAD(P)-dependent oxidoreductase [Cryptosporangium sp. NPDC048952]|uniref:NAD(P)-dependent oxidoreductase n=1 Tax=Cryptosporangium sp. NPDC048952 TaxID=3363961 RepID=UPI003716C45F
MHCRRRSRPCPSGAVLVQHTTCDPATASRFAALGAARGIAVLDAALSGTPRDVSAGRLTLRVGGDAGALERVRPLLDTYAAPVLAVGPSGSGQRIKLVNNALFVAQVGLAIDAVRLGAEWGLPVEQILPALEHGSGASRALSAVGWIGLDQVAARLAELMLKDVDVLTAVAARSGTELGLLGEVLGSDAVRTSV